MSEAASIKVGDRVKLVVTGKLPEWYKKMPSKGAVLKVGERKAFIQWKEKVIPRWHWIKNLQKLD